MHHNQISNTTLAQLDVETIKKKLFRETIIYHTDMHNSIYF